MEPRPAVEHERAGRQVVHHLVPQLPFDLGHFAGRIIPILSGEQVAAQEAHVRVPETGVDHGLDQHDEFGGRVDALPAALEAELAAEVAELADVAAAKPESAAAGLSAVE